MSKKAKRSRRANYEAARGGDLTSYAAMAGDSFAGKINLLNQLLRGVHEPSIGRYKERLLASAIAESLPKRFEVGTGFVLFPKPSRRSKGDTLSAADHEVSQQLDLIVFDSGNIPPVFRDGDFVVLRPESVRAIIEVKAFLKRKDVQDALESFADYSHKWAVCQRFYQERRQVSAPTPGMFLMAWDVYVDPSNRPATDGTRLRKQIVRNVKRLYTLPLPQGYPVLDAAYIYNDCIVSAMGWFEGDELMDGYATERGQFVRYGKGRRPALAGDQTVAALIAGVHWHLRHYFNPILAYVDQERRVDVLPHEHAGQTPLGRAQDVREPVSSEKKI